MLISRRDALRQLGALFALQLLEWPALLDDPLAGTVLDYQAGRARGDWSAESATRQALQRASGWNSSLHAVDALSATAVGDARASDARARHARLIGPLDGVPLFAKSIYDMRGLPTTASSREWARLFPASAPRDSLEIARMRAAGAVVLGKTVADDFAYHGNGTSSLSGQVRNPYDPNGVKTPGGSSAGSAVAVACGIAFAALGTDDGGSNRIPAQFCGIVGMKPTFGLVPRTGVIPTWPYLDTHGPLARNVADAALLLAAIAGPDASDGLALATPWGSGALSSLREDALRNARIGVVEAHVPRTQMSVESLSIFERAVADITSSGAVVDQFAPTVTRANVRELFADSAKLRGDVKPDPNSPAATANALLRYFINHNLDVQGSSQRMSVARVDVQRGLPSYQKLYDVLPTDWDAMDMLMMQPYERDAAGVSFARSRKSLVAKLAEEFRAQSLDAMIYPTMPFPAPRVVDAWPDIRTTLGYGNWLGLPEVSVPSGMGSDGLPAGNISFVGLPGSDAKLLALAHSYERRSNRFVAPPAPVIIEAVDLVDVLDYSRSVSIACHLGQRSKSLRQFFLARYLTTMSLALARKYRPKNFASVAVQSHVANTLKGAIARDRVAHGYLLCGPRGTGKTTLARVLAMALNCERRADSDLQGEPCGECSSCTRIWAGSASLDVVEIDAASNRGVDDARELRERAMYAPSGEDRYKVYIVDEAHMLTREAWNALLKILEEPPPRVVFVFATTEPQKIAQTAAPVLSRLQRFDLKRIGPSEIRDRLAMVLQTEGIAFEPEALAMIARSADGGLRDALSLTDQALALAESGGVTTARVRDALGLIPDEEYLALLDLIFERRAVDVFPAVQSLADNGVDFGLVLAGLGDLLRASLAVALGGAASELGEKMTAQLALRADRISSADLLRMLHALLEMEPMFRRSGQQQLLLETLLVRFALLDRTVELEDVLKGFGDVASSNTGTRPSVVANRSAPKPAAGAAQPQSQPERAMTRPPAPQPATQLAAQSAAAAQTEAAAKGGEAPSASSRKSPIDGSLPSLELLKQRWPEVVSAVKSAGRGMVAESLQRVMPVNVTRDGVVVLSYAAIDDTFAKAVESGRADVLAAIQGCVEGVIALSLHVESSAANPARSMDRLTKEEVSRQRTQQLRDNDPLLDAAVRALDLELMD